MLAGELLGLAVPPRITAFLTDRTDIGRLVSLARPRLLSSDAETISFPRLVTEHLRFLERWRDRASLLYMLALQPGERDLVLLPTWLAIPPFLQAVRLARTVRNLTAAIRT